MSQEKKAQIKFYKIREDKEIEKVIDLENKVKALDDIVYKTGQSVQTMNLLNRNCKISFVKPEFLKKVQRANPCLYDIGCYNDNLALMLAHESDEMIRLAQESRSKLKEMAADLRYFNSLEHEVDSLKSQLKTQKTQFLNEINRLSRECYYADHMDAILGVYTTLDEFTDLQCDYVDKVFKCERLEKELLKSKTMSKSFEALQKHAINLELALQQYLKAQLKDKQIAISELKIIIKKIKGKSVETKFEKPSVIRQPIGFKSQRQSVLGKPATFSDSLAKTDFSKLKTKMPMVVPISTREPKRTMNQSIATPLRRTVALESTNQKPRSTIKKLYEHVSKTCSWWYPKFTPSGYKRKPKSPIENVNINVSMPLGNESRTADILEPMTPRCSTLSNTPLSSNSFATHRDNSIHRRLWVLKAHDRKS
ncbi:hypothetical protein Tco_1070492 [Tanacetum coccineum]|uniref:Uncharacterized protein n=1 Tax=Tanacetum coccineum TaxID=301880 RepID=A0ABQ5HLJ5_9ASTR